MDYNKNLARKDIEKNVLKLKELNISTVGDRSLCLNLLLEDTKIHALLDKDGIPSGAIIDNRFMKLCRSPNYNFNFRKDTGYFERWGAKIDDDPQYSPFGPEILDIEITTKCNGVTGLEGKKQLCPFCYKSNNPNGLNMSFENFKTVFDKIGPQLTQLAVGADSEATSNPDLWKMMEYCRENGVIPNITVAEISDETADKLKKYCGAVACSRYANKNICYDSIKKLTDRGMNQINIHVMASENTYDMVMETLRDRLTDPRMEKLNAIVILSLKKRGRGKCFNTLSQEKFRNIVDFAMNNKIGLGFDSCSCHKFLEAIKDHKDFEKLNQLAEPCESFGIFSSYVDVNGVYFPCSFAGGQGEWKEGIDVLKCDSFFKDVWTCEKTVKWRNISLSVGRKCPLFDV